MMERIATRLLAALGAAVLAGLGLFAHFVPGLPEILALPWPSFVLIGAALLFVGIWQRSRSILTALGVVGALGLWLLWPRGRDAVNPPLSAQPAPAPKPAGSPPLLQRLRERFSR